MEEMPQKDNPPRASHGGLRAGARRSLMELDHEGRGHPEGLAFVTALAVEAGQLDLDEDTLLGEDAVHGHAHLADGLVVAVEQVDALFVVVACDQVDSLRRVGRGCQQQVGQPRDADSEQENPAITLHGNSRVKGKDH